MHACRLHAISARTYANASPVNHRASTRDAHARDAEESPDFSPDFSRNSRMALTIRTDERFAISVRTRRALFRNYFAHVEFSGRMMRSRARARYVIDVANFFIAHVIT